MTMLPSSMKHDYEIRIRGAGGCINNLLFVVEKALRDAGFPVEVENDAPTRYRPEVMAAHVANVAKGMNVGIVMDHIPWGG
jgi:hypothetical protein